MTQEQLKIYREMLPGLPEEQLEAVEQFAETVKDAARQLGAWLARVATALRPVVKILARYLTEQAELEKCPNRRVVYLAKHARKARVRKKNLHRAARIIKKEAHR